MALSTGRKAFFTQFRPNKGQVMLETIGRTFSLSTSVRETGGETNSRESPPNESHNPLLHVQTHTGVRNMAHGLHILRQIEGKFGAIESYLFPRESGTNEYHPVFFFRFRDPKSIRRLAKPFTHFDVPTLTSEDKPNHAIGINDIGYLISPDSHEFSIARGLELMKKETGDSVGASSEEDAAVNTSDQPSTLKSRYAVRIAVSSLNEYPQPFFSHKTINPQEKPRIQRELAAWKSAYEVLGTSIPQPSQSEIHSKTQTIEELLQENFNVPQNTLVLPRRKRTREPRHEENNAPEQVEEPPQQTEYQLFKVHSRRGIRPTSGDPPPKPQISAETIAGGDSSVQGAVESTSVTAPPIQRTLRLSTKRERQLEQMRRAAASQVRSIAEKRKIEEESAKQPNTGSEVDDHIPPAKRESSLWDRFLKR